MENDSSRLDSLINPSLNRSFNNVGDYEHVFLSADIKMSDDGGYIVTKNIFDYDNECSKPLTRKFKASEFYFHRYLPFSRIIQNVIDSQLVFLSPKKWNDPFERIMYKNQYNYIACLCFTCEKTENEEAAWKTHSSNDQDKTVRLSFSPDSFFQLLNTIGQAYKVDFYIQTVDYSLSRDELKKLSHKDFKSITKIINALSFKRKAFSYENEVRVFAVKQDKSPIYKEGSDIVVFDKVNYTDALSHVTLPPYPPFPYGDKREKLYGILQYLSNYGMRCYFDDIVKLNKSKIKQSRLYEVKRIQTSKKQDEGISPTKLLFHHK